MQKLSRLLLNYGSFTRFFLVHAHTHTLLAIRNYDVILNRFRLLIETYVLFRAFWLMFVFVYVYVYIFLTQLVYIHKTTPFRRNFAKHLLLY